MNVGSTSSQITAINPDNISEQTNPHTAFQEGQSVEPFIKRESAFDEGFQSIPQQKKLSSRASRIESVMNRKRLDMAVLIQPNTRNSESIPILRTIEFFGLKVVFIPEHLSERVACTKSILPGSVEKWLELLPFPNGKEVDIIENFKKYGFLIVSSDELTKSDHQTEFLHSSLSEPQKQTEQKPENESTPTLLVLGQKEWENNSIKNRLSLFNDSVAVSKLSRSDEAAVSDTLIRDILQDYPRTECFSLTLGKKKKSSRPQHPESFSEHGHPVRSNNNTVFVLDKVDRSINLQDILLIACDRGMEELHYIGKTIENRKVLQDISDRLKCPVHIRYFDSSEPSINDLKQRGFTIYASTLDPEAITLDQVRCTEKKAIIVGNEAQGISSESRGLSDIKVMIPGRGFAQSLNVSAATAILADALAPETPKI